MSKGDSDNHPEAGAPPENQVQAHRAARSGRNVSLTPFLIGTIVFLLTINGLLYLKGAHLVKAHARTLAAGKTGPVTDLYNWNLTLTITSLLTGMGLVFLSKVGFGWWRKNLLQEVADQLENSNNAAEKLGLLRAELQRFVDDNTRLSAELNRVRAETERRVEERTHTLAKAHAQLEAELNERRHAEKALARQAQELGRSKDVLELHVQARTHELQKLKSRYESILNSAGEGIYGLDLNGKMTFVNPAAAKLTGWNNEELSGRPEQETFGLTPAAAFALSYDGQPSEMLFTRRDGTSFPVEYVRTPIIEKDKIVGAAVIFKDITERKQTEDALARKAAELARSNAELEQFAYVASHDLQEPLRKIQAFGDRLKSKCDAAKLQDGREYLERMQSAAARMQRLIEDLLTFSRVISATQPFVPVDLGVVTREVLTDLEVRIEQSKAKVEIGTLPTIDADPLQVRQLLQNLIGNALKFQPPEAQPVIKIYAEIQKSPFADPSKPLLNDELCALTIEDNGIGFEEKYLDKIFSVFQRLHGRTEYEGTGVGLAVCRRITDRHGGTITGQSELGKGAKFIVTLPVKHPKQEKPS
jgi:two-component system sensor kinase FixL